MTTLDVKNINGTDSGYVSNGVTAIYSARAGTQKIQTLNSPGKSEFLIDDFDNGDGPVLKDRIDDPRYYSGDTAL